MVKTNFRRIVFAVFIMIVMLPMQSWAQDGDKNFKVGERVEYREGYPPREVWHEGTIVKLYSPEDKQVLVHWDPRPDYAPYTHNGVSIYEQAYSIDSVRHIKTHPADKPVVENGGPKKVETKQPEDGGKGLMTHEEILGYLRTHGYVNGQHKNDRQVCIDLIEQIKRRGVTSRLEVYKDDLSPIYSNGCGIADTDVEGATEYNVGTPTTVDWLSGTWLMYVIGGTVDTARGGYIYRKNESIAKLGFITINGNGTYTWKVNPWDTPAKYVKDTWRMATKEEMKLQGGTGIVLHNGEQGADWIVYKYMIPDPSKIERIDVQHITSRGGMRRIGWRK